MSKASLKEMKKKKADIKKTMLGMTNKESEDDPMSDEDVASFEKLKTECDRLEGRIARLTAALEDDSEDEDRNDDDDGEKNWSEHNGRSMRPNQNKGFDFNGKAPNVNTTDTHGYAELKDGDKAGRFIVGQYWVREHGMRAAKDMCMRDVNQGGMGGDSLVAKMLTTSQPVIPQDFNPDFIRLLQTKSTVRQIAKIYNMSRGNLTVPRQRLGSVGAFLAEGANIPTTQLGFDTINLTWHKYGAVSVSTKELLEFTPLDAASTVADDLTNRLGLLEDRTSLFSAGSDTVPTGITNLVNAANILNSSVNSSGKVDFQTVGYDLALLKQKLAGNMVDGPYDIIMEPGIEGFLEQLSSSFGIYPFAADVSAGKVRGSPFHTTTQLASNLVATLTVATTALTSSSTTLSVPTVGIQVGDVASGAGISGSPTVASITDSGHLVLSASQTSVASAAAITFTAPLSNMTQILMVKGSHLMVGDAYRFAINMTTDGSFYDGSEQVNIWGQDLVGFKATNAYDFNIEHDVSAAVLQARGWSLNNRAGVDFYQQAASNSHSSASSV